MFSKLKDHLQSGRKYLPVYIRQRTDNQNIQGIKKLNSPQINEPIKKWAAELNRAFSKKKFKWLKNT
jgi:hypothetical protein